MHCVVWVGMSSGKAPVFVIVLAGVEKNEIGIIRDRRICNVNISKITWAISSYTRFLPAKQMCWFCTANM